MRLLVGPDSAGADPGPACYGRGGNEPTVTDGPSGENYKDLSVTFTMPTNFLFFNGPNVNITKNKRVYIANSFPEEEA